MRDEKFGAPPCQIPDSSTCLSIVKHGNSRAIIVDKSILEAAGISEDTLFEISVSPDGRLVIESVEDSGLDEFRKKFKELNKKHKQLMKNLSKL